MSIVFHGPPFIFRQKRGSEACAILYGEQTGPSQAAGGSANGLTAYLEGLSFRGMERILQVGHVAVIQWIRR
jgi:transposase-like protein